MSDISCKHGQLARSCYICELEQALAAAESENARLKAELKREEENHLLTTNALSQFAREKLDAESALKVAQGERDEAVKQSRHGWERHAEKDRAYGDALARVRLLEQALVACRPFPDDCPLHRVDYRACPSDCIVNKALNVDESKDSGRARPNDGRSGRCGIRISGDAWCVLDVDHEGEHGGR